MYKEESSANAAILHNVKEVYIHVSFFIIIAFPHNVNIPYQFSHFGFCGAINQFNGNYIFVDAPWCSGVPEDFFPNNPARTALLSNLPYDVKVCMDPLTNYAFAFFSFHLLMVFLDCL